MAKARRVGCFASRSTCWASNFAAAHTTKRSRRTSIPYPCCRASNFVQEETFRVGSRVYGLRFRLKPKTLLRHAQLSQARVKTYWGLVGNKVNVLYRDCFAFFPTKQQ